jgi:hypothetical protein
MRYTRFGLTDLAVSRVCFGTRQFGSDWGSNEETDLVDAIRRKFAGIFQMCYPCTLTHYACTICILYSNKTVNETVEIDHRRSPKLYDRCPTLLC